MNGARRERSLARVGEELRRQLGGSSADIHQQLELGVNLLDIPAFQQLLGELGVAEDPGEQVVEIVGDAARQNTEALELLRIAEALLDLEALRDIAGHDYETRGSILGLIRARGTLERHPMTIAMSHVPRSLHVGVAGCEIGEPSTRLLDLVGVQELEHAATDNFARGVAEDSLDARTAVQHFGRQVRFDDDVVGVLGDALEALDVAIELTCRTLALVPRFASPAVRHVDVRHVLDGAHRDPDGQPREPGNRRGPTSELCEEVPHLDPGYRHHSSTQQAWQHPGRRH